MKGRQALRLALALLAGAMLPSGKVASQSPHTHHHDFGGAHRWAKVFDDPERDAWQKPHEVIQALALEPDAVVADIGAGTGYFTVRLAHMLSKGKVYAVDAEPDMVKYLAERAKREGLKNVIPLHVAPESPRLPERADLILFVDVYHHVEDRGRYLQRLRDSLGPAGRIAVIDFRMDAPVGPPASARIPPDDVKREFDRAGYAFVQEHAFLPHQYFLVFSPVGR